MKNILMLTHGNFADGIKSSLEVICGSDMGVSSLCVSVSDTLETVSAKIKEYLESCPDNEEKVIITDIPGGSTTSAAIHFVNTEKKVYVVTGLNLGLLLEIVMNQEEDASAAIATIVKNAKETMLFLNPVMDEQGIKAK